MNIYVGNLSYNVTEEELRDIFSEYGEVSSVNIITDKYSGQSKGFGFVEMPSNSEADRAIKALNESSVKAFEKAGFEIEGQAKSQFFLDGQYYDSLYLGITGEGFLKKSSRE